MAHRVAREHPVDSQLHASTLTNYYRKIPIFSENSMFNKLLEISSTREQAICGRAAPGQEGGPPRESERNGSMARP